MADGGGNDIPILKICFRELEETAKVLKRASGKEDNKSLWCSEAVVQKTSQKTESRGVLYLKPTITPTSSNKKERTKKAKISCPSNSAVDEICVDTIQMKLASRAPEGTKIKDQREELTEHRSKSMGSSHQRSRTESRKSKELSKSSQMRSKSTGDQPHRSGAGLKVELRQLLDEWERLSKNVERSLARWNGDVAKLGSNLELWQRMRQCAEKILSKDIELFSRQNLTSKLWKGCIYPIIEKLRAQCAADADGFQEILSGFLSAIMGYYNQCLQLVQGNLNFRLSALAIGNVRFTSKTQHREVMVAVVMCHNWFIYLGDVARYQQQLLASVGSEVDWSRPRQYYLRAQQLAPKNGKPYNQLAVVAINTHRRLDAVYYYMRSLATVPPFQSAYDSLVAIFAETGQKAKRKEEDERMVREREAVKAAKRQRKAERLAKKKEQRGKKERRLRAGEGERRSSLVNQFASGKKEIWIMPGSVALSEVVHAETKAGQQAVGEEAESGSTKAGSGVIEGGCGSVEMESGSVEVDSNSVNLAQVAKKVTSCFLVVQGKLFSKTGGDRLGVDEGRLLDYLGKLLRGPIRQELTLLLFKMAVINIYAIHHALDASMDLSSSGTYFHCGRALHLAVRTTQLLILTCSERLGQHKNEQVMSQVRDVSLCCNGRVKPEEQEVGGGEEAWPVSALVLDILSVLLPAARLLFDWFITQEKLAARCTATLEQSFLTKFWSTAADFLNRASATGIHGDRAAEGRPIAGECEEEGKSLAPSLWEDRSLAGFMPIKGSLSTMDTFALPDLKRMSTKEHREQVISRILILKNMWCLLCSKPQVTGVNIGRDTSTGQLLVLQKCYTMEDEEEKEEEHEDEEEEEDDMVDVDLDNSLSLDFSDEDIEYLSDGEESGSGDQEVGGTGYQEAGGVENQEVGGAGDPGGATQNEIQLLKAQRDGLARQLEERELAEAMTQTVLNKAASKTVEVIYITPNYLVPDTNCFVDQLSELQELVQMREFVLAVPLIVLAELEGLGKGAAATADRSRLERVSTEAKTALNYIKTSFQVKCPQLKALTTQGSLLPSLAFRAEVTEMVSNDDLILNSCLQLHLKTKSSTKPGGASCYKVVLLTDDRNLRVKAHAAGQPVKDISSFMALLRNSK